VKHQREVGTGYFDAVTQTIQAGQSSTTAMRGSTEEEQFDHGEKETAVA
jgi:isocitrate lyase